jgi:SAM-dependent methyltransferase
VNTEQIKDTVRRRYGAFAAAGGGEDAGCGPAAGADCDVGVYDPEQLAVVPAGALRLSRGCGNPTRLGALGPGDTVIDLGCGGGIDVIVAAHQVGPGGTVIGVDFAPEMLQHATLQHRRGRSRRPGHPAAHGRPGRHRPCPTAAPT